MIRYLAIPALSLALSVTPPLATPARAGDADALAAALLGAGVLFVIVEGLGDRSARAAPRHVVRDRPMAPRAHGHRRHPPVTRHSGPRGDHWPRAQR
ncbi:hypothetical protein RGUI_3271 [Rhodovulum sp. P5]|uniref:hypothetical protein n=1 Tax=Rhodovulum sp. P5 TaxID=1564506 RepID=UPI0009C39342|nr:hypothetical protein [Rhodovulum sp. P5]ARE41412.1 hypothetical protein RGUI_3271 [Rhodovulum sp. P5]